MLKNEEISYSNSDNFKQKQNKNLERRESKFRSNLINASQSFMRLNFNIGNQGMTSSKIMPNMRMPLRSVNSDRKVDSELAKSIQSMFK